MMDNVTVKITMCNYESCPLRGHCRRYVLEDASVTYFEPIPYNKEKKTCDYFMLQRYKD